MNERTMKIWHTRFNIYLGLVLAAVAVCLLGVGCSSPEKKRSKALTALRVHPEGRGGGTNEFRQVEVLRSNPVKIWVRSMPSLTEEQVKEAKVLEVPGGYAIEIQFDNSGSLLLEQLTSGMSKGKRLAFFVQFVKPPSVEPTESRWLAAPIIRFRITDGKISFTPDATEEEMRQIVLGLNNAAKKHQKTATQW
jgi:preprotein translocase subunit SecD